MNTTATAPAPSALRFQSGARERDSGVFYDETKTLTSGSQTMPEAKIPAGDWLRDVLLYIDVTTASNSASTTFDADGPFNVISKLRFLDANGTTLHDLSGYDLFLVNLLNAPTYQSDPRKAPGYSVTTGSGGTGGSASFQLVVPVEIIKRDAIGALPNGSSNSVTRIQIELADSDAAYGTSPTNEADVRVRMIERGYVQPSTTSPGGKAYATTPPGSPRTFQQIGMNPYDLSIGRNVEQAVRKGNVYRSLIMVVRNGSGVRSNSVVTEAKIRLDKVENMSGPWEHLRHVTWTRQNIAAADLPDGVFQVSFAHEWDGLFGGEVRDLYVPTMPGSLVEFDVTAAAAGQLQVITQEIVTPLDAGVLNA